MQDREKIHLFLKSLNTLLVLSQKTLLSTSFSGFFSLGTTVFLIWCHENLVTANTMFSKADLASEGGKLSRASSALFPW